jgi:hypothetical protein
MRKLKYVKLFENFIDEHDYEYKAVQNQEGKWEIHVKEPMVDDDFILPTSGTLWTNGGKYYSSEEEAINTIKSNITIVN